MMIRTIVLILLTTISVQGQDSTLVKEFCSKVTKFSDTTDIEAQVSEIDVMIKRYMVRYPMTGENPIQEALRFQYRLSMELKRTCPNYPSGRVRLVPKTVIDLENKLSKQQIDSLSILTSQIKQEKKVYLYIVTINDFYPDSTITDFSNRYREFWAPLTTPGNGVVLVVFSATQREVRISTGDISMTYLTDAECTEVNKIMLSHFKNGNYFDGLANGLLAIKTRL